LPPGTSSKSRRRATAARGAFRKAETSITHRLEQSTTTDFTADQIHQIGLEQVAAIHGEMERIKNQVGFTGTLQQFFAHIIEGNEFKYPNTDAGRQQYLADARSAISSR
jgi:uncharacterized protein (DUF885 family)